MTDPINLPVLMLGLVVVIYIVFLLIGKIAMSNEVQRFATAIVALMMLVALLRIVGLL